MGAVLEEVRRKISQRHLGRHGIHGVGARATEKAVYIYVNPGTRLKGTKVLGEIKKQAAPFKLRLVEEEPPTLSTRREKGRAKESAKALG